MPLSPRRSRLLYAPNKLGMTNLDMLKQAAVKAARPHKADRGAAVLTSHGKIFCGCDIPARMNSGTAISAERLVGRIMLYTIRMI